MDAAFVYLYGALVMYFFYMTDLWVFYSLRTFETGEWRLIFTSQHIRISSHSLVCFVLYFSFTEDAA